MNLFPEFSSFRSSLSWRDLFSPERLAGLHRRIFCRKVFQPAYQLAFRLSLNGLGIGNSNNIYASGEAAFLRRVITKRKDFVLVDIGARRGLYSLLARKLNKNTRAIAVEPHPETFRTLKENGAKYQFECINLAVSDRITKTTLYDANACGTHDASLHREAFDYTKTPTVSFEVQTTTVDSLAASLSLEKIDLLKIDAEGHEYEILLGATETIRKGMIKCIQFEFEELKVFRRQFLSDFAALLPGYELFRILADGNLYPLAECSLSLQTQFGFQNIVAVRPNSSFACS